MPLLNCCVYDGYNEYLKERATLAIKFLMEGCKEAQDFVKELVPVKQAQVQAQAAARAQAEAKAAAAAGGVKQGQLQGHPSVGAGRGVAGGVAEQMPLPSGVVGELEKRRMELERNLALSKQKDEGSGSGSGSGSGGGAAGQKK